MDAFALSGGSIRGGWQAGVIAGLTQRGIIPGGITGISVGSLNTAGLAAWQPIMDRTGTPIDPDGWRITGQRLADFWLDNITSPKVVIKERGILELGFRFVRKDWQGLVDTSPLREFVKRTFDDEFPTIDGIPARVGYVNLRTGLLEYRDAGETNFLDAVMASTAEPVIMPVQRVNGDRCVDGGIRDIAPLGEAIKLGATRVCAIVCQSKSTHEWDGKAGDLLPLVSREVGIMTNETVNTDLKTCERLNTILRELPPEVTALSPTLSALRIVDTVAIHPGAPLDIDIRDFTRADILRTVEQGLRDGLSVAL
jgi:NTE family protein